MRAAAFIYHAPRSLNEALGLLQAARGGARLLAGGQSLVPEMLARSTVAEQVIDLRHLGLDTVEIDPDGAAGGLRLGATVTQAVLERSPEVNERAPLLAEVASLIGYRATRARGTIGGSVAHGDPRAEIPVALVALDATMSIASPRGEREIRVADFCASEPTDRCRPNEIITAVTIPRGTWSGHAFVEQSPRRRGFALASVAVLLGSDPVDRDRIDRARVCLGAVADRPVLLPEAVEGLMGQEFTSLARLAGRPADTEPGVALTRAVTEHLAPPSDFHATGDYRRHLAAQLLRRAIACAAERGQVGRDAHERKC